MSMDIEEKEAILECFSSIVNTMEHIMLDVALESEGLYRVYESTSNTLRHSLDLLKSKLYIE